MNQNKPNKSYGWQRIFGIIDDDFKDEINNINDFSLKQAESFVMEGDLPIGVLYLKKGKLREVFLDGNNEPFTIRIYKEGDFVGFDHLLRQEKSIKIIASTGIEGKLLKAKDFLKLCAESSKFREQFSKCYSQELFYIMRNNISKIIFVSK